MPIQQTLSESDRQWLLQQGIDPDSVQILPADPMSKTEAVGRTLAGHTGGTLGGGAGAIIGGELGLYGGPAAPITVPAGAIIGGLIGGYGGQKAQEKILPEEMEQRLEQGAQLAAEQHPYISLGTDIASGALASGGAFSPSTTIKAARGLVGLVKPAAVDAVETSGQTGVRELLSREGVEQLARNQDDLKALRNVGLQSILNPAINSGVNYATTGQLPTPTDIVGQTVGGALFGKQAKWSESLTGRFGEPDKEPLAKQEMDENLQELSNRPDTSTIDSGAESTSSGPTGPWIHTNEDGSHVIDDKSVKEAFGKLYPKPDISNLSQEDGYAAMSQWRKTVKVPVEDQRTILHENWLKAQEQQVEPASEPIQTAKSLETSITPPVTETVATTGEVTKVPDVQPKVEQNLKEAGVNQITKEAQPLADQAGSNKATEIAGKTNQLLPTQEVKPYREVVPAGSEYVEEVKKNSEDYIAQQKQLQQELKEEKKRIGMQGELPKGLPEKSALYNDLIEKQKNLLSTGRAFDEKGGLSKAYLDIWKQVEELKNTNKGQVPGKQSEAESYNSLSDFRNQPDQSQVTPQHIVDHIWNNNATTGSVIEMFSKEHGNAWQPLSKWMFEHMDSASRKVPWSETVADRSTYYPPQNTKIWGTEQSDVVQLAMLHSHHAPTVMEEALHSMTSAKIPIEFNGLQGSELLKAMTDYLGNKDGHPAIKDLIKSYIQTAQILGIHQDLFNRREQVNHGVAGSPDLTKYVTGLYAMGDLHEFIAHAFMDKPFQEKLNSLSSGLLDNRTMWQRVVEAIRNVLGMPVEYGSMLDRVLRSSAELIRSERPEQVNPVLSEAQNRLIQDTLDYLDYNKKQGQDEYENAQANAVERLTNFGLDKQKAESIVNQYVDNVPREGINSPTLSINEKDESKKGFFRPMEATFDKVDRDSKMLGEAGRRWEKRKDQYLGLRNVAIKDLQEFPVDRVNKVMAKHREAFRTNITPKFSNGEDQKISQIFQNYYGKIADIRRELGITIKGREAGKNPYYVPDSLSDKTLDLFTNHATSSESIYAEKRWVDYVMKESDGKLKREDVEKNIQDYIAALGGEHNNYNSVKFKAIREAQGYGLPEGLRETDGINSLNKYGNRAAADLAMFQELETKPVIAASLKLRDPLTGNVAQHPEADTRLAASKNVKQMMKWVTNSFTGTMSQQSPKVNALVRLVNNSLLGTATGIRDTFQMPVFALPYINRFEDLSAALKGIANYRNEARNALLTAANKPSIDKVQFDQISESPDRVSSLLNKFATLTRKYQGREAIENFNREVTFSIGKELARSNILGAKAGSKRSIEFLKKFGTLIDSDPLKAQGPELEQLLNQYAKNFTDRNQGSYGGTGLPAGVIESQFAPFLSLQKWSLEKSNIIYKDVIKPFITGENRLPLITYTLGSVISGAAIQELNKLLSGRKSQDPEVKEALQEANTKNIVGELATLMQLSSYAGIVGDTMKWASDTGLYGKTPRNIVSFPTATAALDLQERTTDLLEALRMGEDPWEVWKNYSLDMLTHNVQALRLIANHTVKKEDIEQSDKFRDVRIFNQLEGEKSTDFTPSNKYLDLDQKKFKQSGDLQEAIGMLPGLVKKAITDSNGDPFKLKQSLEGLKANNYQIVPNPQSMPLEFTKYISYVKETQGEQKANELLSDYIHQQMINKVKSSLVP